MTSFDDRLDDSKKLWSGTKSRSYHIRRFFCEGGTKWYQSLEHGLIQKCMKKQ